MLQWFVHEKVAIGAVKDSCRFIEEEEVEVRPDNNIDAYLIRNKTLGRVRDPRANGAWLSKLTE